MLQASLACLAAAWLYKRGLNQQLLLVQMAGIFIMLKLIYLSPDDSRDSYLYPRQLLRTAPR